MQQIILAKQPCIGVRFGVPFRLQSFYSKRVLEWILPTWMGIRLDWCGYFFLYIYSKDQQGVLHSWLLMTDCSLRLSSSLKGLGVVLLNVNLTNFNKFGCRQHMLLLNMVKQLSFTMLYQNGMVTLMFLIMMEEAPCIGNW